ncbi:uncharacterized protein AC631_05047 [Debaryomyces fabryi]|uniref:Major facilitator superfamily (MFS) profile domain-containing protein n=1 Tax=Debaryomyces fabryi TaxID=58627 RepID=A0A0V1PSH8_9ASCO|nr:uncharacterized protein AC631_05047 [Debaryomyces fabryi]KRZ99190.1 hypothetical protein AC631_05047 [Debaryomyces fabryi]CUM55984.1 unnamed protein product [Debaryomyces fabryi]
MSQPNKICSSEKEFDVNVMQNSINSDLSEKLGDAHMNILPTKKIIICLLVLAMALMVSFIDQTGVTVATSVIGKDLDSETTINWAGTASLLANCICQVLFGRLSDIFGRKNVLMIGLLILAIADIGCGVSKTGVQFYVCRALAGIGNGCSSSLPQIILSDIVTLRDRGKYQGILGMSVGLGNSIGPFLMAGFIHGATWRHFYYLLCPLNVLVIVIIYIFIKDPVKKVENILTRKEKFMKIDYLGIFFATACLTLLLVPISGGGSTYPWNSSIIIAMFIIGGSLFFVFLLVEWKFAKLPMIPLRIFKLPMVSLIFLSTFFFGMTYFSFLYYQPYYFEIVKNKSIVHTSLFVLPFVLCQAVMSVVSGQIITHTGHYIYVIITGYSLWLLGNCLLLLWNENVNDGVNIVSLLIIGCGVGFTFQPSMVAVQAQAKKADRAVVISTRNVIRSFGGAVGIAVGSTTVSNSFLSSIKQLEKDNSTKIPSSYLRYLETNIYSRFDTSSLTSSQTSVVKLMYVSALKNYFYLLIPFIAICLITSFLIKDKGLQCIDEIEPLRKNSDTESYVSSNRP